VDILVSSLSSQPFDHFTGDGSSYPTASVPMIEGTNSGEAFMQRANERPVEDSS
jgi:hypothetical protein